MLYVSIFVELLRARPALVVWLAVLAQAVLWALVPALFYSGPPGDVPFVLAVGHEFQLGTYLGPPLAFWLGMGFGASVLLPLLTLPYALSAVRGVLTRDRFDDLVPMTPKAARLLLAYAVLLAGGVAYA